jgi:hypothetical protein
MIVIRNHSSDIILSNFVPKEKPDFLSGLNKGAAHRNKKLFHTNNSKIKTNLP